MLYNLSGLRDEEEGGERRHELEGKSKRTARRRKQIEPAKPDGLVFGTDHREFLLLFRVSISKRTERETQTLSCLWRNHYLVIPVNE